MKHLLFALFLAGCGEAITQGPDCAAYVDCVRALDAAEGVTTDVARFDVDGDCWGIEAGYDLCERSCDAGLQFLRARVDALPEDCR